MSTPRRRPTSPLISASYAAPPGSPGGEDPRPPQRSPQRPALSIGIPQDDGDPDDGLIRPVTPSSRGSIPFVRARTQREPEMHREFQESVDRAKQYLEATLHYQHVEVLHYIPDQEAVLSFDKNGKTHQLTFYPRPAAQSYAIRLKLSDRDATIAAMQIASQHSGYIKMLEARSEQNFLECCVLMNQLGIGLEISNQDLNYNEILQWLGKVPAAERPHLKDNTQAPSAPSASPTKTTGSTLTYP